jgi:hypothetical protein
MAGGAFCISCRTVDVSTTMPHHLDRDRRAAYPVRSELRAKLSFG